MAAEATRGRKPLPSGAGPTAAPLVPCILLRRGEVQVPSEDGPVEARTPEGAKVDPFDVVDRLSAEYPLIYLVDLDGIERGEPQLDFLQELSRDATLWVDGGVRVADQAIDILVTGAQRAVLSSGVLRGPKELRRAWRLSTELVFEVEVDARGLVARPEWEAKGATELAEAVRAVGVDHLIVSPREVDPDWALVRAVAAGGPTWVDGTFEASDLPRLREAGARGGIFHLDKLLGADPEGAPLSPPAPSRPTRDDET